MFFILSKILQFLISPMFWLFVLLIWAIKTKYVKRRKRLLWTTVIMVFFFGNGFIVNEVFRWWEEAPKSAEQIGQYEVGIVLGGMASYDSNLDRIYFRRGHDRFMQAYDLYNKGIIKKILVTSGSGSIKYPESREALQVGEFWLRNGMKKRDLLLEAESRNTYENAVYSKELLDSLGKFDQQHLLITSAFHLKRAADTFSAQGYKFDTFATDRYSGHRAFTVDGWFIPSVQAMDAWTLIIHEVVGYWVYKLRGYA